MEIELCGYKAMEDIVGAKILKVDGLEIGCEAIVIKTDKGTYHMFHSQDCCETVEIDDIVGDLKVGSTIHEVTEKTNIDLEGKGVDSSFTWTFYTIRTSNGYCDIKWYGTSNGYYSEYVYFVKRQ